MTQSSTPLNAPTSRRQALRTLGLLGVGVGVTACAPALLDLSNLAGLPATSVDAAVLNFALNLEYLEAAFYLAATGRLAELQGVGGDAEIRLPAGLTGVPFQNTDVRDFANELASDEIAHVKFLIQTITALGGTPVPRPVIDLNGAFDAAGQAASGGAIKGFNPFLNDLFFLHGAYIFEDVGVTAYKGASPLINDDRPGGVLEQAAGILAVEGYHAGAIRSMLYERRDQEAAAGLTVAQVTKAISDLRDTADGAGDKDQGLTEPFRPGDANIVLSDANAVAFSRLPREVLNIVYLQPGAKSGGFFPNGVNGLIK
ncbi:ferritin-like domain-containing protein [Deinococcus maricopensis]|uniref:Twin-arginine translocation pathway signal n=1 Tax=Deinococcus maricopensis (strain DSM 21211 / LMG 22137 / NRRL B-23946 / LB-34) TaxID=709986 RepID=E8U9S7_DEIML|nr:ferritin-like domain-containing protein [Deinococcus maricopensis]ADV67816.1 twin-arginine translocation pathway signal [Deinococcus maricopensis DSM 21211]